MPTLNHGRSLLILVTTSVGAPSSTTSGSSLLPTAGKSWYYISTITLICKKLMANVTVIIFSSLSLRQSLLSNCSIGRQPHLGARGHWAVHVCGCHLLASELRLPDPGLWHHADETGPPSHNEPVRQAYCPAQSLPCTRGHVPGVWMGEHLLWSRWAANTKSFENSMIRPPPLLPLIFHTYLWKCQDS